MSPTNTPSPSPTPSASGSSTAKAPATPPTQVSKPAAGAAAAAGPKGLPSRVYSSVIGAVDKFVPSKLRPFWQHPAGPKTIFFWAPVFKWGLVIAGLSDLARPAESISVTQCGALAATGIIWSRYSLVIIPKNYGLFSVNIFVALTQCTQLARAYMYKMEQDKKIAGEMGLLK